MREEPKYYDDDSILEEDLEFNPEATDVTKVFVEQPPSPEFKAATGTFKAIKLEAEDAARDHEKNPRSDEREAFPSEQFDPGDTQVDVEIDPDLLAAMASMTSNRLQQLDPTSPPPAGGPVATPAAAAPPAAKATPPKSQPPKQAPPRQPPQPTAPMRLAERAKARADAARVDSARPAPDAERPTPEAAPARSTSLETAQAIRAALMPRRRAASADSIDTASDGAPAAFLAGMWTAGSVVLLIALALQVIHHYRHDLAATTSLNGPLTAVYAALGIPLVPRWNLNAYEVHQLGASTAAEAPGQITVRASVKNGARQAQPLPLLRVTLQDRFGNRIAARDVPPQAYLPRAIPGSSVLSAGQRIDAEMAFVDPGANAVGFEIDACLPAPGGGIACANDAAAR